MRCLQEIRDLILRIAITKFSEECLHESLAIFYFLATVAEEEPDYWYRLGLTAEILGNYDLALQAFNTASNLAPDFIGSHLYAAECYIEVGNRDEAVSELEKSKECLKILEVNDLEEWSHQIGEIEQMLDQLN